MSGADTAEIGFPTAILVHKYTTPHTVAVYIAVRLSRGSHRTIAALAHTSVQTVRRELGRLRGMNWIDWESTPGGANRYSFPESWPEYADFWKGVEPVPHKNRRPIPRSVRAAVFLRDGFACVQCFGEDDLTLDHVVPYSCGGDNSEGNLRVLCRACNSKRGVPQEYRQ